MSYEIRQGDARELVAEVPDASVPLIVADPPYGLRKGFEGDHNPAQALSLVADVLPELARVLKPNGSLYLFAGSQVAARVEVAVGEWLHVLGRIIWVKPDPASAINRGAGGGGRTCKEALRNWWPQYEAIIFAEHPCACVDYEQTSEGIRAGVFESIRQYLDSERRRAGVPHRDVIAALGMGGHDTHFFSPVQWKLPLPEQYETMRRLFSDRGNGSGPYLRREYEDIRREYEDLRRPFSVTADVPYTDVWDFPTVAAYPGKHPCEKPQALLEHIIRTSSRPGDTALDCFMGSGTTGVACVNLGRDFLGFEIDPGYCEMARRRLAGAQQPLMTV